MLNLFLYVDEIRKNPDYVEVIFFPTWESPNFDQRTLFSVCSSPSSVEETFFQEKHRDHRFVEGIFPLDR